MYYEKQDDNRCAAVRQDDIAGITSVYPTAIPPSITGPELLPEAVFNQPYRHEISAIGGAGNFQFTSIDGECQHPGLSLTAAGVIEGVPQAQGQGCFDVRATDANGDDHTRRLLIPFVTTPTNPSPTPTATPTPIPPTPTATRTSPPVEDCVGDCSVDRVVTVGELVRAVNIALGILSMDACQGVDTDGDGAVSVDELLRAVLASIASCTS
jgi:hypothetical protein